ncbi:MAG: YgiQ family radical SAM protein, partial [Eudoraea sp.]|nr:YgiQ family radical SAM protein [Eudoraea sp.]
MPNTTKQLHLPTTAKEVKARNWDQLDVILFSGDAYVDHPAFGIPVIGRLLEHAGYRVAIIPQPNWQDDLRDFKKLGKPRLFFGVSAGAMDSMVNHYTARKKIRSNDAYTPGNVAGFRPDYPSIVYTKALKQHFPDTPVVLGGVEASLRRLTHYDYWNDRLKPGILVESGADMILYGMGEEAVLDLAALLDKGVPIHEINDLKQSVILRSKDEAA